MSQLKFVFMLICLFIAGLIVLDKWYEEKIKLDKSQYTAQTLGGDDEKSGKKKKRRFFRWIPIPFPLGN